MLRPFLLAVCFLCFVRMEAQNFSNGFPFTLPAFDSTTHTYLPVFERRSITEFIDTDEDGHFIRDGEVIRFWGVNLTTGGCFPQKENAAGIAARMRKMGINLVRFHHMDNPWTGSDGSIFLQNGSTTSLNPLTLDRLHYLLAQMKAEGVYADINLHVSRTFTESDGVAGADSLLEFGKAVNYFDEQIIGLQKEYARQLLTAVNPYTGLSLADDPVMAMLEITNENTLYGFWKDNRLHPFADGGGIMSRHSDTLDLKWNRFLLEKYGTQSNLESVWQNAASTPPEELIIDGGFESGDLTQAWTLEQHEGAQATAEIDAASPYSGDYCAKISVTNVTGTDWHIQFEENDRSIETDSIYSVHFFAKADAPSEIIASAFRNAPPWTWYGGTSIALTTEWQEYSFSFTAPETNDETRVSFSLGIQTGTFWIDDVSMKRTRKVGLEEGEDLALGNIRRMRYNERLTFNEQRVADMAEFYLKLQKDYYDEMHDFLSNELGVRVPITGSNALGGAFEPFTHQDLDYIDDHAYWDHPQFPNQPWSPWDWYINNNSMLMTDYLGYVPGIFGGLQMQHKPLTISELNHPQPNIYQAEMVPILAGYGAFHGADGFMFFEYNGGDPAHWDIDVQNNYFSLHRNTPVMALFPIFSYAFRKGLIQEDPNPTLIDYSEEYLYNTPQQDDGYRWMKYFPYDNHLALTSAIKISSFDAVQEDIPTATVANPPFTTHTDEITFFPQRQLLRLESPQLACVAGQLEQAPAISGIDMQIVQAEAHGVIVWASLTGEPLVNAQRSLITFVSRFQNQGMTWDGTTTVHNNWGESPTEVQALDISVLLHIEADSIRLFPLDPTGQEGEGVVLLPQSQDWFLIDLDQSTLQSLWFGIEAYSTPDGVRTVGIHPKIGVFPNPVPSAGVLHLTGLEEPTPYQLMTPQGQVIQEGLCEQRIVLKNVPAGVYYLVLQVEGEVRGVRVVVSS